VSPEQLVAILTACAAIVSALAILVGQVASLRKAVDGRLTELVDATWVSAHAQGELVGRRRRARRTGDVLSEPPPYLPPERPVGPLRPQE
jgi:hypothetical protein